MTLKLKTKWYLSWKNLRKFLVSEFIFSQKHHPCSTYTKFSEKLIFFIRLKFQLTFYWFFIKFKQVLTKDFINPLRANIYLFIFNNKNNIKKCKIPAKLTIKKLTGHHWSHSGVFIDNFEHISHLFLAFLLFTWNK